jgi:hypothetical protein
LAALIVSVHPSFSGLNYDSTLNLLHENALGRSTIIWREFERPQRTASVILKLSDRRRFAVTSRSHLSLFLVLLRGELKIFLVRDVFNCTFTDFLCNPIRRTDMLLVDNELQHLALSKIVGKVPYKVRRGFATYHFVVGEPVPYL